MAKLKKRIIKALAPKLSKEKQEEKVKAVIKSAKVGKPKAFKVTSDEDYRITIDGVPLNELKVYDSKQTKRIENEMVKAGLLPSSNSNKKVKRRMGGTVKKGYGKAQRGY